MVHTQGTSRGRQLWITSAVLAAAVAVSAATAHVVEAASSDPWTLRTTTGIDVISPIGLDAALCAIRPALSRSALRNVDRSLATTCRTLARYPPTSIWVGTGVTIAPSLAASLRSHAELYQAPVPLNARIRAWLEHQGALVPELREPLDFAVVSAVSYSGDWWIPLQSKRIREFHGRRGTSRQAFVEGTNGAWLERYGTCERVVAPLKDGGHVILSRVRNGTVAASLCIGRAISARPYKVVRIAFPIVHIRREHSLKSLVEKAGMEDLFDPRRSPFSALQRGSALSDIVQAVEVGLDGQGVRVRATTLGNIPAGVPHATGFVIFDVPFVVRVVDPSGRDVAMMIVNDL